VVVVDRDGVGVGGNDHRSRRHSRRSESPSLPEHLHSVLVAWHTPCFICGPRLTRLHSTEITVHSITAPPVPGWRHDIRRSHTDFRCRGAFIQATCAVINQRCANTRRRIAFIRHCVTFTRFCVAFTRFCVVFTHVCVTFTHSCLAFTRRCPLLTSHRVARIPRSSTSITRRSPTIHA
jgi:hypothetical protein